MSDGSAAAGTVVHVPLGERAYDIHIGPGALAQAGEILKPFAPQGRVAVVADRTVADLHLGALEETLGAAGIRAQTILVPSGESSKSMRILEQVLGALLDLRLERSETVIAFGGGVAGDLAGFAAAILRRGVRCVQIPTTLLSQVDSSVGGKTGINAPQGKNLIGAFHQPASVIADVSLLDSLPERELRSGYAEVVKYGLLGDAAFFEWLEANGAALLAGDAAARTEAIAVSCRAKARIVVEDETEAGNRALLNLGHTFGHALEAATGYSERLLHGEGVAIGMALAFETSRRMGLCAGQDAERAAAHLRACDLKTRLADIPGDLPSAEGLIELMAQDKKASGGKLTFILVRAIGQAFKTQEVDLDVVRAVLSDELTAKDAAA
ncbi:MAG: 3-dehydroquinate synthase [Neomegalonema sp.]|nr:3-dehydroquinate synthase [Neomegalonema sp.]